MLCPATTRHGRLPIAGLHRFVLQSPIQFIFVDDGSTDNTFDLLGRLAAERPDTVTALRCETNKAKAEAVRYGNSTFRAQPRSRLCRLLGCGPCHAARSHRTVFRSSRQATRLGYGLRVPRQAPGKEDRAAAHAPLSRQALRHLHLHYPAPADLRYAMRSKALSRPARHTQLVPRTLSEPLGLRRGTNRPPHPAGRIALSGSATHLRIPVGVWEDVAESKVKPARLLHRSARRPAHLLDVRPSWVPASRLPASVTTT